MCSFFLCRILKFCWDVLDMMSMYKLLKQGGKIRKEDFGFY